MRKIEIKGKKFSSVGEFGQYDFKKLMNDGELPRRLDFYPKVLPNEQHANHESVVTSECLEVLESVFVDGKSLTDLYDWKMNISSFNPHGWGVPKRKYYMVGILKPLTIDKNSLKEMIRETVKRVLMKEKG